MKKYFARIKNSGLLAYYRVFDTLADSDRYVFQRLWKNGFHNPDYRFSKEELMFIHLPKTGGTSFVKLLQKDPEDRFVFLNVHKPVSTHCPPSQFKYVTVMRDPVDRVWSQYQMLLRSEDGYPYRNFAVRGLETLLKKCWAVRNMNCRYLTGQVVAEPNTSTFEKAAENLKQFYAVLDFRKFSEETSAFMQAHGIPFQRIPNERNHAYELPTESEVALIKAYNQLDIALYQNWKADFQEVSTPKELTIGK